MGTVINLASYFEKLQLISLEFPDEENLGEAAKVIHLPVTYPKPGKEIPSADTSGKSGYTV